MGEVLAPGLKVIRDWANDLKRPQGVFGIKSNGVDPPIKTGVATRMRGAKLKLQCDREGAYKSIASQRNRQESKRYGCTWRLNLEVCAVLPTGACF